MAIVEQHRGIVIGCSILAGLAGLFFGWFPGSDLFFLNIIWIFGLTKIFSTSDISSLSSPKFRIAISLIGAGLIIAGGIELVSGLTLPIYFIVNPILNALATYRMLRAASKLLAANDGEELSSNIFTNIMTALGIILGVH